MKCRTLVLLFAALPGAAAAQVIYKCTDANGGTLIANAKVDKSCRAIVTGPETAMPAPPKAKAAATPSPAGFPRVGEETQKARDGDRRHILDQELATEQRGLEQAKKDLAEQEALGPANVNRLPPYRDRVGQHERNIQAIQKELANLK